MSDRRHRLLSSHLPIMLIINHTDKQNVRVTVRTWRNEHMAWRAYRTEYASGVEAYVITFRPRSHPWKNHLFTSTVQPGLLRRILLHSVYEWTHRSVPYNKSSVRTTQNEPLRQPLLQLPTSSFYFSSGTCLPGPVFACWLAFAPGLRKWMTQRWNWGRGRPFNNKRC